MSKPIGQEKARTCWGLAVLGLNLYDDDRDGVWDRAKLDMNRNEVDDEKWTFKKGRWEKDGGATIWDGKVGLVIDELRI